MDLLRRILLDQILDPGTQITLILHLLLGTVVPVALAIHLLQAASPVV